MAFFDLYINYLTDMRRDELRLTAKHQGIVGFTRMDRPELIVKLLELKVTQAERVVINEALRWYIDLSNARQLTQAIAELESLNDALREWNQKWEARVPKDA